MTPADHDTPTAAAADWLIRRQAGLSASEAAAFDAWLTQSEAHRRAWTQAEAVWAAVDAEDDPLLDAMRTDALTARPQARQPVARWAMSAAAALVIAVGGFVAWHAHSPTPVTYAASAQPQMLTLADGSQVALDPGARLEVAFTQRRRDLHLRQGRATFEVRHESRPFAVEAGDATITATGTRFSVEAAVDVVSATLVQGVVVVMRAHDPHPVTLAPGQTLVVARGQPMRVSRANNPQANAVAPRFIEFRDTPLDQAVAQLNQHSERQIRVIGAAASLKITGRFRSDDPLGFVAAVAQLLPVRTRAGTGGALEIIAR